MNHQNVDVDERIEFGVDLGMIGLFHSRKNWSRGKGVFWWIRTGDVS